MRRFLYLAIFFGIVGCGSEKESSEIMTTYDSSADRTSCSTSDVVVTKNWIGGAEVLLRAEIRCPGQNLCTPEQVSIRLTTPETDSHELELITDGKKHEFGQLRFSRKDSFFSTSDISTLEMPYPVFIEFASAKRVEGTLGEIVFTLDAEKLKPFKKLVARAGKPPDS